MTNTLNRNKTQFTKEQRKEYLQKLKIQWRQAKKQSENMIRDDVKNFKQIKSIFPEASATGFIFCLSQMREMNLQGLPYQDAKTFYKWKDEGKKVKKGSKSFLKNIAWVEKVEKDKDDKEASFAYPKVYSLFDRSQVE